jgi:hypothetical protein
MSGLNNQNVGTTRKVTIINTIILYSCYPVILPVKYLIYYDISTLEKMLTFSLDHMANFGIRII